MEYEMLPLAYWRSQVLRIVDLRSRIVARGEAAVPGRVVPEDDELVIGTGRRLNMAVMFLDLCGFSGRPSETLWEQDILLRVLNLFFTEMIRIAEEYGGTVEKNTGDGLMAYFEDNAGTQPEGGCKRSISCALTMMYTTATLINPIIRATGLEELHFRIGIDYGPVTVAQVGAARRFGALVAIGTTANVASKMLRVAGPDEILLGESVVRGLPLVWQIQWCRVHKVDTGWIYRQTGNPYPFYRYNGRWTRPL